MWGREREIEIERERDTGHTFLLPPPTHDSHSIALQPKSVSLLAGVAILEAFYPGVHGAHAIAATLFGDNAHLGGKLPITNYPAGYTSQIKMANMNMVASGSSPGRSYKYYTGVPSFPFGHGISLSTFRLTNKTAIAMGKRSDAQSTEPTPGSAVGDTTHAVHCSTFSLQEATTYSTVVTNTGSRTADEVVFAFYRPPAISTGSSGNRSSTFTKALFGFERIHLAPGQSTVVSFAATAATFKQTLRNGDAVVIPGIYTLDLTNGVDQTVVFNVNITGRAVVIEPFPA